MRWQEAKEIMQCLLVLVAVMPIRSQRCVSDSVGCGPVGWSAAGRTGMQISASKFYGGGRHWND